MGWNSGYTIFEQTVIGAYDLGKLDRALLDVLMEPYRGTDIDPGGSRGLRSKDGLDVEEIVSRIHRIEPPRKPRLPADHTTWTEEQWEAQDDWESARGEAFGRITRDVYGWR
jgi:hypothetical protein